MAQQQRNVRRQILRRVRYATNTLALLETRLPPEGPFDAALTNGLLLIVSTEWPGEETRDTLRDFFQPASELLKIVEHKADPALSYIAVSVLQEGLDLTQPFRHGRADDEFATINRTHIDGLSALDQHPALDFIEKARGRSVDDAVLLAYEQCADYYLPFDLKDRLDVPEPEDCPACWRPTFLPVGWDEFGGTSSPGECISCGYKRSDADAREEAVRDAMSRHRDD